MADAPDNDQKTEAPSAKRLREAGKRGEVLQSRELAVAFAVIGATAWLWTLAPGLYAASLAALRVGLVFDNPAQGFEPMARLVQVVRPLLVPLAGFAALAIGGLLAGPMLTSVRFAPGALAPKAGRISPAAGLKRMFGMQAPIELVKATLKAGLLLGVGLVLLKRHIPELLGLGGATPGEAALRLGALIAGLLMALTAVLLFIAMIDLPVQYMRHMAKLRMSKQEVKDESKESEGSPESKAAIRRMQRLAARGAVRPAMAEATVVVVNPTSFAVALRYDPLRDAAPVVVARGRELAAAAIRELAGENGVPVLRYPQLTRALYFTAKLGQPIRDDLFTAVAAVLAFVFSLDRAAMAAAEPPEVTVPDALRFDEFGRAAKASTYRAADR